ncbi:hypothetical protein ACLQ3H_16055 [Micromonospora saelicesensis]|uniref:hypothetical protein n=1 Tax=Micromonospora saelicesensis TaxID=285676 RepID=UPI003CEDEF55
MSDAGGGDDLRRPLGLFEPSSLDEVKAAIEGLDLARMRWAVRSLPLEDALTCTTAVMAAASDPQLRADLGRLGEMLADQRFLDGRLARRADSLMITMLLSPHGGPGELIATQLIEDPDLPLHQLILAAASLTNPALKAGVARRLIAGLDTELDLNLLIGVLAAAPERDVNDALLAARPRTALGCEQLLVLLARQLDRTQWLPHRESFVDLVEACAAVMRTAGDDAIPEASTVVLLRGIARSWAKQGRWRAAGVASSVQLLVAPDAEALGRAVSEASSIADWPLLERVIDGAWWAEDQIDSEDAEVFLTSVTPTVGRLRARGDRARAETVVELAEACAAAVIGPLSARSLELLERMRTTLAEPPRMYGMRDFVAYDAVLYAVWGHTHFGGRSHDITPRSPAAQVLRIATKAGSRRRQGPLALLLLADLAIEFGDLRWARDLVEQTHRTYPRHSTVLAAQRKLAAHTRDSLRMDKLLDEMARLWNAGQDDAGFRAQVSTLQQMHGTRGWRLAEMRARQLLQDPRAAEFRDKLERLRG